MSSTYFQLDKLSFWRGVFYVLQFVPLVLLVRAANRVVSVWNGEGGCACSLSLFRHKSLRPLSAALTAEDLRLSKCHGVSKKSILNAKAKAKPADNVDNSVHAHRHISHTRIQTQTERLYRAGAEWHYAFCEFASMDENSFYRLVRSSPSCGLHVCLLHVV